MSQQIPNNHSVMSVWKQMIIRLVIIVPHLNTMANRWKWRVCSLWSFALHRITSEPLLMEGKRMLGWQQNCCLPFVIWLTCWQSEALIMLNSCIVTRYKRPGQSPNILTEASCFLPLLVQGLPLNAHLVVIIATNIHSFSEIPVKLWTTTMNVYFIVHIAF
jgi:hypothetical protein